MSVTFLYILVWWGETEGAKFCPCSHEGGSECCSVFPPPQPPCVFCCVLVLSVCCTVSCVASRATYTCSSSLSWRGPLHPPPSTTCTTEHFFPACTLSSFTQCFFPCCPCLNEHRSSADGKRGRLLFPERGVEALTSLMMLAAVLTWSGTEIGGKIMIVWRTGGRGVAALFEWVAVLKTGKLSSRNPPHPTPPPPCPQSPLHRQERKTEMIDIFLHHNVGWCIVGVWDFMAECALAALTLRFMDRDKQIDFIGFTGKLTSIFICESACCQLEISLLRTLHPGSSFF